MEKVEEAVLCLMLTSVGPLFPLSFELYEFVRCLPRCIVGLFGEHQFNMADVLVQLIKSNVSGAISPWQRT